MPPAKLTIHLRRSPFQIHLCPGHIAGFPICVTQKKTSQANREVLREQRSLRLIDSRLQQWNSRWTLLEVAKRLTEGEPCRDSVENIGSPILSEFGLNLPRKVFRFLILFFRQVED